MPLFFVHGVNVRKEDATYERDAARRTKLFRDVMLAGLVSHGRSLDSIAIRDIYWGDLGVTFAWNLASLPKVSALDAFGAAETEPASDAVLAESLELIARSPVVSPATGPVSSSPRDTTVSRAATEDPVRFAESLLLPLLLSDFELTDESSQDEGELQALLARATADAAADPEVQRAMIAAASDDELIDVLTRAVDQRFHALAKPPAAASVEPTEAYGASLVTQARLRLGELFSRVLHLPGRAASVPALQIFRPGFHRRFSRFLGDVFEYLHHRGDAAKPGPIVTRVLAEMNATPTQGADDPVIVITHSMGGNIIYDILTTFSPRLSLDVWISVGGQVAQFEEMKLFLGSDATLTAPKKVGGIKERVGYWLNVYDPTDAFGFMVDPVFAGVDADLAYSTGAGLLKSHGEYFGLASLHRLMGEHIKKGLKL